MIEVKPEYQLEEGNNKFKFEVGVKYSEETGLTFLIATETSIYSTNNGSTTEFLREIEEATATILNRMMTQSDPTGNSRRLDESTSPPTI